MRNSLAALDIKLQETIPFQRYIELHKEFGMTKKMFTILKRNPENFKFDSILKLTNILNISFEDFVRLIGLDKKDN
jgi:DNA-binding Xre family transcriptional regulator